MQKKVIEVKLLNSIFNKTLGLLCRNKPENLLINTRFGIHTFGMKFPIDVIILDKNMNIVKIRESLQPNRVFFWNVKFDHVLELPEGYIKQNNITLNSRISLKYK